MVQSFLSLLVQLSTCHSSAFDSYLNSQSRHSSMIKDTNTVTPEEIAQFRTQLADYPSAIAALDAIEEYEGYLEDAIPFKVPTKAGTE
ncbi:hypothetical protein [Cylindrospermopsis raciborskii]|uniref:hypothetical protein n=1 Tax=Cylindrospermopsis raciborskii TaxID=77022 RepID=UPI0038D216E5